MQKLTWGTSAPAGLEILAFNALQHNRGIVVLALRAMVPCRQGKHRSKHLRLQFEFTARNAKQGILDLHDDRFLISNAR